MNSLVHKTEVIRRSWAEDVDELIGQLQELKEYYGNAYVQIDSCPVYVALVEEMLSDGSKAYEVVLKAKRQPKAV